MRGTRHRILQKAWPTVRRWFGIGDAIGGLPELTEQVGLLATTLAELSEKFDHVNRKIESIEDQVANSHEKNFRDDVDDKHDEVLKKHSEISHRLSELSDAVSSATSVAAAALEVSNNNEKATVRLWERIDFHHPPEAT